MSVNNKDPANVYACSNTGLSMMCKGEINGIQTDMLVDTGSVYTMVHYDLYKEIENQNQISLPLFECKSTVVSANSEVIDIYGIIDIE